MMFLFSKHVTTQLRQLNVMHSLLKEIQQDEITERWNPWIELKLVMLGIKFS